MSAQSGSAGPKKVACIGGGPAGLYFAILTKKRDPGAEVVVYERNRLDDTFGFGVVFSDATLEGLARADRESYEAITSSFFHWDDIEVFLEGKDGEHHSLRSKGHGFSGLSRKTLLQILTKRALELGVSLRNEETVKPGSEPEADLLVVADGVNSAFREHYASDFKPDIGHRPNRFVWLGTTFPFEAFTFYFKRAEAGLFQVHAYRYEEGLSTFIVECSGETWEKTGLGEMDEDATVAYFEKIFEGELKGHRLLKNRSHWRRFPVIRNGRWHRGNMVLLGDAVHTAHYSIGSGTKLALEDAIALRDSVDRHASLDEALDVYENERRPVAESLQRAAQVSLEWFENTERPLRHDPLTFMFSLLTRSLRVTHENLMKRDPELVRRVDRGVEEASEKQTGRPLPPRLDKKTAPRPPMFTPFKLRDLVLENRVGVSSMCMYNSTEGTIGDFQLVHLGSRAIGGAGLVMTEMTNVSADGRITPGCAGLYGGDHAKAWKRVVDFVHKESSAKIGIQLGHAGRKGATKEPWFGPDVPLDEGGWPLLGASALPWAPGNPTPKAMTSEDLARVKADFVRSTELAEEAGFDLIELHAAHGYLLSNFISPLTNHRTDEYGGSLDKRLAYPLEVFRAIRAVWPAHKPMSVRISASDWAEGGTSVDDLVTIGKRFKEAGCDILDVSAGGTVPEQKPAYGRVYQVPFSDVIRNDAGIPTMTVGNISSYTDVNGIIAANRADVCLIARGHLFDPYWVRHAAAHQDYALAWPRSYGVLQHYNARFI